MRLLNRGDKRAVLREPGETQTSDNKALETELAAEKHSRLQNVVPPFHPPNPKQEKCAECVCVRVPTCVSFYMV